MIEELDAVMEVMETAFDPHWGEAWNRAQVLGSLQMPHSHLLIADPSGDPWAYRREPAGFLLSRNAPGEEELLLVAVVPAHRGKRIGATLMERFRQYAQARGAERLFLEMRANNPAERLYRAQGYQPIGRRKDYYRLADGSRLDAITFALDLETDARSY